MSNSRICNLILHGGTLLLQWCGLLSLIGFGQIALEVLPLIFALDDLQMCILRYDLPHCLLSVISRSSLLIIASQCELKLTSRFLFSLIAVRRCFFIKMFGVTQRQERRDFRVVFYAHWSCMGCLKMELLTEEALLLPTVTAIDFSTICQLVAYSIMMLHSQKRKYYDIVTLLKTKVVNRCTILLLVQMGGQCERDFG